MSGSVSTFVNLYTGSTLTLGASMTLNSYLDVEQGSTLNMAGYPLSAPTVYLGWGYNQPVSLLNGGPISTNNLYVGGSSTVTLSGLNDVVNNQIALSGSTLALQQANGQVTGLTFHGAAASDLTLSGSSVLQLTAGSNSGPNWLFRWQDPSGGNWQSTLAGLISGGSITITSSAGYSLFDEEGYTYIAAPALSSGTAPAAILHGATPPTGAA